MCVCVCRYQPNETAVNREGVQSVPTTQRKWNSCFGVFRCFSPRFVGYELLSRFRSGAEDSDEYHYHSIESNLADRIRDSFRSLDYQWVSYFTVFVYFCTARVINEQFGVWTDFCVHTHVRITNTWHRGAVCKICRVVCYCHLWSVKEQFEKRMSSERIMFTVYFCVFEFLIFDQDMQIRQKERISYFLFLFYTIFRWFVQQFLTISTL